MLSWRVFDNVLCFCLAWFYVVTRLRPCRCSAGCMCRSWVSWSSGLYLHVCSPWLLHCLSCLHGFVAKFAEACRHIPHCSIMAFPVNFQMDFTERLSVYWLVGSASMPDAETLTIPLLQQQIHGFPVRQGVGDWLFLSYQLLDGVRAQPGNIEFRRLVNSFVVVGTVGWMNLGDTSKSFGNRVRKCACSRALSTLRSKWVCSIAAGAAFIVSSQCHLMFGLHWYRNVCVIVHAYK